MPSATSTAPVAPPTLPSPQPFDILTTLTTLLHRLLTDIPSPDDPDQDLVHTPRHPPLQMKHFQSEALKVKNTLNEARRALQSLPDLDKSLQEQEVAMRKLESVIERKKGMLRRVGAAGYPERDEGVEGEDVRMED